MIWYIVVIFFKNIVIKSELFGSKMQFVFVFCVEQWKEPLRWSSDKCRDEGNNRQTGLLSRISWSLHFGQLWKSRHAGVNKGECRLVF